MPVSTGGGPTTMVAGDTFAYFAATSTDAYWILYAGLWRKPLAGGPATMIDTGTRLPYGLVVDDKNIYVLANDNNGSTFSYIATCALPDCPGGLTPLVGNLGRSDVPSSAAGLGQDATSLYWVEQGMSGYALKTCAKTACTPTVLTQTHIGAIGMCVDQKAITWTGGTGIGRFAHSP